MAAAGKGGREKGGFAYVHVADDPAVTVVLAPLKVTVRCIPMDGPDEPGTCVITGKPVAPPQRLRAVVVAWALTYVGQASA